MKKIFFRSKYDPRYAILRVPVFVVVGYLAGFVFGISTIPEHESESEFTSLIEMYLGIGIVAGLAAGAINEVRLAYRPR